VCKLITGIYYEGKQHFEHPSCSSLIAAHDARKKKLPVQGWDRLRLEVALVDGQSVHSSAARSFLLTPICIPGNSIQNGLLFTPDEEKDKK